MKLTNALPLTLVLFSFDSMLKIDTGSAQAHVSHILLILLLGLSAATGRLRIGDYLRSYPAVAVLLSYLFLHALIAENTRSYLTVMAYFVLAVALHLVIHAYRHQIDFKKLLENTLKILIATGLIQYGLATFFNYQIAFADLTSTYYREGGSIAERMRGFFLEPNWFGLYLTSTLIAYFIVQGRTRSSLLLIALALICLYLSGNRLTLYFATLSTVMHYSNLGTLKSWKYILAAAALAPALAFLIITLAAEGIGKLETDRSAAARTVTAFKTTQYIYNNFTPSQMLTGEGLGSWGQTSYIHDLSFRSTAERVIGARDTSESYVIILEIGFLGAFLLIWDLYRASQFKNGLVQPILMAGLVLSAAFFYPIFFFMMYLVPYFTMRAYLELQRT